MAGILLILFLIATPSAAEAQIIPSLDEPIEIAVIPSAPRPGESIVIRVQTYSGNPGGTTFVWSVDGRVVEQGVGRNMITVTAPGAGSAMTVSVSATEDSASRGEASVTIRPASVDILWEADTSVPPLSGILPLPNGGSRVIFFAAPHIVRGGARVSASELIYTWRVNGSGKPALKGHGASTFRTAPPAFGSPFLVSVTAETREGDIRAEGAVTVQPVEPEIVIYEVAPLLGTRLDRAIGRTYALSGDQATFAALPLYMKDRESLGYAWSVNGRPVVEAAPRSITLRKTGEGGGRYTVEFSLKSATALFERAKESFTLTF